MDWYVNPASNVAGGGSGCSAKGCGTKASVCVANVCYNRCRQCIVRLS